jgi:glutaminase
MADYDGRTALHLAAAEGQLEVVRYLLAIGTEPQPVDRWGGTPLSDAEGNGHTQVVDLLRQAVRATPEAVAV